MKPLTLEKLWRQPMVTIPTTQRIRRRNNPHVENIVQMKLMTQRIMEITEALRKEIENETQNDQTRGPISSARHTQGEKIQ
jgi:hypothetical protein